MEKENLFPIDILNKGCLDLIAEARELEWMTNHWGRQYHSKIGQVFDVLEEFYGLDSTKYIYRLDGSPPKLYCDGERKDGEERSQDPVPK